ncbi:hypothetical protein HU200_005946 [Digitaria exilis]|uniref:F-box domain-containing protein n=1 Tax=Digitaria exilis TaxID=1010633 RepID=A0A835FQN8_9POAL|nr:hypothetical protein HU200_005946 [Digitaria exilis]
MRQRKRRFRRTPCYMSEEMIREIMVWLPVKSLIRSRSVCKAWQAIISDPVFILAHLHCSTSKWEQDPCVLISPHTLDFFLPGEQWPSTFSNHIHFYQWRPSSPGVAKFLHAKKFIDGMFTQVYNFAYCDGLVLTPTDNLLYLFNPATRDAISLPHSNNRRSGISVQGGSGRQAFYRTIDAKANLYRMGMEVFTVGEGAGDDASFWKELPGDLPFPIKKWQTALTVKRRFLFWRIDRARHQQRTARGLLRLDLSDESFTVTALPDAMGSRNDACIIDELHGELCLTARCSETTAAATVWAMEVDDDGRQGQWERRYSVRFPRLCHVMAPLPDGRLLLWNMTDLYGYEAPELELEPVCEMDEIRYEGRRKRRWKNLWSFNVKPYTESLVRLTA